MLLSSRKASDLEEAVAELKAAGIDAQWIAADCANEADIRSLADEAIRRLGGHVDIREQRRRRLGLACRRPPRGRSGDKVMNLNVRGYFILSQHIAKHSMIARKQGSIINVASIAGLGGNPSGMNTIAYNTSKGR